MNSRQTRLVRLATATALGVALCVPAAAAATPAAAPVTQVRAMPSLAPVPALATAATSPIDTSSQAAVAQTYLNDYLPTQSVPVGWTGTTSPCVPGTTSAASKAATETAVNYFRRMGQLSTITLDPNLESGAQQAALIMLANNKLSHNPPNTWACWTQAGADTAGRSNLAWGAGAPGIGAAAQAIRKYMTDSGTGNEMAGHRRWVMNPQAVTMGSGSTSNTNALVVFGTNATSTANPNPAWVSWPTPGYFPTQLEPAGRWSLTGDAAFTYDFSNAEVSVTDPSGATVPVTVQAPKQGFANDALVWEMGTVPRATGTQVLTYTVSVTGIKRGSTTGLSTTYQVKLFDPATPTGPTPTVSGTAVVGATLTAQPGAWSPSGTTLAHQWKVGGVAVSGATAATYAVQPVDVGKTVTVTVTGTYGSSTGTPMTSAPTAAVVAGTLTGATPTISGTAQVGSTLTANPGTWGPAPVTLAYQWLKGGVAISGATTSTYTPTSADQGATIAVRVTGSKAGYTTLSRTSAATAPVAAAPTLMSATPAITGTAQVGATLTANPGTWGPAPVTLSYQWLRNGAVISGASSAAYPVVAADLNATISVRVTGTKAGYATASTVSAGVGPVAAGTLTIGTPTISGNPVVGQTLTANPGTWGPAPVTLAYQWHAAGMQIAGATGPTYVIPPEYEKYPILVTVTGTKPGYTTGYAASANTQPVTGIPCGGATVAGRQLNLDVTCDGVADLFTVDTAGNLDFHPGTTAGPFGDPQRIATGWGDSVAIVSPGAQRGGEFPVLWRRTPDAQLLAYQTSATTGGNVSIRYLGTVGARWSAITAMSAAGDVDGDGYGDVYGRTTAGDLWLYFGAPNGGIRSQLQVGFRWNQIDAIFGGFDVTGDGMNDVIARHAPTGNMLRYPSNAKGQLTGSGQVVGVRWNGLNPLTSTSAPVSKNRMVGRIADGRVYSYTFSSTGTIQPGTVIGSNWQDIRLLW